METKRCNRCGEEQAVEAFYLLKQGEIWRAAYCKPCDKAISTENARKHPGRNAEYQKRWRAKDPLHARLIDMEKSARYRWRKAGLPVEPFRYADILARDGWRCYLCSREVTAQTLNFDHVTPRSKGGSHTADNVRVAHTYCNEWKGEQPLGDYPIAE